MKVKIFEILDKATFIPMFAVQMASSNIQQRYLLRRAGFGEGPHS